MVQCRNLNRPNSTTAGMALSSSPHAPLFRTTLFFGPEPVAERPGAVRCVFNVKKRSWKSGIQVDVRLRGCDVARAKDVIAYEAWVDAVLAARPPGERDDYRQRADDLLIQTLCARKLELALEAGAPQDNHVLGSEQFVTEFEQMLPNSVTEIKEWVLAELDVET